MQIDRNIPLPTKPAPPRIPVEQMQIGDSVLTPYTNRTGAASVATLTARRAGLQHNFITAMDGEYVRVWRKS